MITTLTVIINDEHHLNIDGELSTQDALSLLHAFLLGLSTSPAPPASVLAAITALQEDLMSQKEALAALSARLNAATNEIAKDLQDLRQKVADGTVSEADMGPLDRTIATLEALGKDPADPVPSSPTEG